MMKLFRPTACVLALLLSSIMLAAPAPADPPKEKPDTKQSADEKTTPKKKPKHPPFATLLKDAKTTEGLIRLHRKDDKLYGELSSGHFDKDFIVAIAIARGIGEQPLLGGMTWGFGDDWLWQFRKRGEKIQIVRRNVRFTATKGSPEERAVRLAYTDSVLFSLPIVTKSPSGAYVVDLTPVFMSDLPQISQVLKGFSFSKDKSTWAAVKGFKDNIELQVAATYTSGGTKEFDTVADSRGVTINVHYSISRLPQTGYRPRLADDRVGYFLTVVKDFSKKLLPDHFVRYIDRWDLRKAEPAAEVSPPKTPIIFWLEKTVPFEYRKTIREASLEWNKAFQKAGYTNAIEVRQQPNDADWDPEDINYNTFRWITSSAGFAMGPTRVNPTTGQILDADIIFDADFLQYWKEEYEVATPASAASQRKKGPGLICRNGPEGASHKLNLVPFSRCTLSHGMARQFAFGSIVMAAEAKPVSKAQLKRLLMQGLKFTVMHEVGHTLGLRHNFKASTFLTLEEINDPKKTAATGLAASVMDYMPIHFAPKGKKQGDYYSTTIGPYDYWAIEYGYKSVSGGTSEAELPELKKIAARGAERALNYATDEDCRGVDPDPLANRFDLGKDPVRFARQQVELIKQLLPDLANRMTKDGEGYQRARRAFNILLANHGSAMYYTARFVGGLYVHRDHKGDPDARPPLVVVPPAKQREALALLEKEAFGQKAFEFPPELYNYLATSKWSHWGTEVNLRADYPVREIILIWQDRVLAHLLSSLTLSRIADSELKVPADQDAFTTAELIERLTKAVFSEIEKLDGGKYTNRKPAISSLRRGLQRRFLEHLSNLAMGNTLAPDDCQTVAYAELEALEARINGVLAGKAQLDSYTRAHLKETADRIRKVLDARLQLRRP